MVSVDGDTSTNDTVMILANGLAGNKTIAAGDVLAVAFQEALDKVCLYLTRCIARDGEGATRMIEVAVNGARSLADARLAARTITSSPLVKSAIHGCDPNWGRIVAAAGRSGAEMVETKTDVYWNMFTEIRRTLFSIKKLPGHIGPGGSFRGELNLGSIQQRLGRDLSKEYVVINMNILLKVNSNT
jgi:glutamate N-acetyltransferase/amino-acid N-acetyltransferase